MVGVSVDSHDHVFIHSPAAQPQRDGNRRCGCDATIAGCCVPAPPVIEFDPEGKVVNAWGGEAKG